MTTLARKMMRINEIQTRDHTPSAIFGSIGSLPASIVKRPDYRIGLWPCQSQTDPVLAMGLWTVLGHLMAQWQNVRVYRLFAQLDDDPGDYQWAIEESQFSVDDWALEDLDENIAIQGTLTQTDTDTWSLVISIENDLVDDEEETTLSFEVDNQLELFQKLPEITRRLMNHLDQDLTSAGTAPYETVSDQVFDQAFLRDLVEWEIMLLLTLWGQDSDDEDILALFSRLRQGAVERGDDFAAWVVSHATARAMLPGLSIVGDILVEVLPDIIKEHANSAFPAIVLSRALYRLGFSEKAYQLLEDDLEAHPERSLTTLQLARLYTASRRFEQATRAIQNTIEHDSMTTDLYILYGDVLVASEQMQRDVEDFYLIEPDDYPGEELAFEAVAAYEEACKLDPDDPVARHKQLQQLVMLDEDRFYDGFIRLVAMDTQGKYVRDIIDLMYALEDLSPALEQLEEAVDRHPEQVAMHINLAALYLLADDPDGAHEQLTKATSLSPSDEQLHDIEQLMLAANHENFEYRFGEITALVNASSRISTDDVDFLEAVVEDAPSFAAAHILLARAYQLMDDEEAALEVLLDAHSTLTDDPDILELLASILWESGEHDVAFEYLNKGLGIDPNHVPLLVRTGRYLFDNGQYADARLYLSRAEAISARDPYLRETKAYIASQIGQDDKDKKNL